MISNSEMYSAAQTFRLVSGNATLNITVYPRPSSETIILLHGGPGVPDEMTEVREWMSQYMQVITFDQRGIGAGNADNCTFAMEDYINDLLTISAKFKLDRFHIFGHSWGGIYAQLFAGEHPEMILSLFLCSPASGTGRIWTMAEKEIFLYNYNCSTFPEWISMGINTLLGLLGNRKAYQKLFRQIIINYHKGYNVDPPDEEKLARINARAGIVTRREIRKYPEIKSFGKTQYPVIITYGEFDAFGKSKESQLSRFPYARKVIIPAAGHTAWKHNLIEFEKVLASFYGSD